MQSKDEVTVEGEFVFDKQETISIGMNDTFKPTDGLVKPGKDTFQPYHAVKSESASGTVDGAVPPSKRVKTEQDAGSPKLQTDTGSSQTISGVFLEQKEGQILQIKEEKDVNCGADNQTRSDKCEIVGFSGGVSGIKVEETEDLINNYDGNDNGEHNNGTLIQFEGASLIVEEKETCEWLATAVKEEQDVDSKPPQADLAKQTTRASSSMNIDESTLRIKEEKYPDDQSKTRRDNCDSDKLFGSPKLTVKDEGANDVAENCNSDDSDVDDEELMKEERMEEDGLDSEVRRLFISK